MRFLRCLLPGLAFFASPYFLFGSPDQFDGTWKASGAGLTTLQISMSGKLVKVHAFGSCQPQDCDWGEVGAQAYAATVDSDVSTAAKAITAQYESGFSRNTLIILPGNGPDELKVERFTVFTDGSRRSPFHVTTVMYRSR